ncbi:unnamed protein product [Rotaria magnacalcarata]|uniref:SWIRM domain-containing protein n=1 Tax=Rotaria magnacalcarata TaxID=392030 RepID=A0A814LW38_9BILA|nr:unnamed protein product [Rotaria magnacalcarata]CAF1609152.1 unnamed protein product [Rotaria magnacalcarata]CAF2039092.1 unnamed protein product [Rotaria magnacalcarata]CAF2042132.1 unnamed protein product [Rotaria magnacalcarata]CAF2094414.1 unnamed protein product [Rotaria magnacalcarata]
MGDDGRQHQEFRARRVDGTIPDGLEDAAAQSRLTHDRMSAEETRLFPEVCKGDIKRHKAFLIIRNNALRMWFDEPRVQLTFEKIMEKLNQVEPQYATDERILAGKIFLYLERYGYINFGVFKRLTSPLGTKKDKPRIIVIGAGIAGIIAARQLQYFGFETIILEGRSRVGGRIATFRKNNFVADLGAMVVTGLGGNPVSVLQTQTNLDLVPVKHKCPMYECSQNVVPKAKDEVVEREFNRLLEACSYLAHTLDDEVDGKKQYYSLGDVLEQLIRAQEKAVREKYVQHLREISKMKESLRALLTKMCDVRTNCVRLNKEYSEVLQVPDNANVLEEFIIRDVAKNLVVTTEEYARLETRAAQLKEQIRLAEDNPPPRLYLSVTDRRILDWHMANLEFANAAPLNCLSLKFWDQDDEYEFTGCHLTVRNGYSNLPVALCENQNIRLKRIVKKITYNKSAVEVSVENGEDSKNDMIETYRAEAVLVTVPLGVLKENVIIFDPPLPEDKQSAIERVGFGNLNKVVLCFDKIFWDANHTLFAHVNASTSSRGELFLFWCFTKPPILIALVAGDAANVVECATDDVIIGRTLVVLRNIFGSVAVPSPKESLVTRWKSDPFARGSYSYVAVGASGDDYDTLARPVEYPGDKIPRVYFAGEHTNRNYPATVHGALLSGLREARRVADAFLGSIYEISAP